MIDQSQFQITIEQPKGSYKSFVDEDEPSSYPLKGVTYPVDYGYIDGYTAEDNAELDVFVGSGILCGYLIVWRLDVPTETKMILNVTEQEMHEITQVFAPVLREIKVLSELEWKEKIQEFKIHT